MKLTRKRGRVMEQQENGQNPMMPQENYGKRFWYLWGPIMIKWVIGFIVTFSAISLVGFGYASAHYDEVMNAMQNQDKMMELYAKITEICMKKTTLIEGVAALITIPILLFWFHKDRMKEKLKGVIPNNKAPLWKYGMQILMSLALSLGLNNLIVIGNLSAVSEEYSETMEAFYSASIPMQVAVLGIMVPICEELVFRGLMFKRMRESSGFMPAALYSSVVFGLMHVNFVQMLYGFFLGMMLAYIYEKYGSVKAPVLSHIAMNLLSVFVTEFKIYDWMTEDIMRMGIITVICGTVASTMYVLIQQIEEKPDMLQKC